MTYPKSNLICPHLKGSSEGASCDVVKTFIKDIVDADIKLCMNRRFEGCSIYYLYLKELAAPFLKKDPLES